jgi:hypothetical protein
METTGRIVNIEGVNGRSPETRSRTRRGGAGERQLRRRFAAAKAFTGSMARGGTGFPRLSRIRRAVEAFREAAQLDQVAGSVSGLARTFMAGLADVDRGADALDQAQRLGYVPGDRSLSARRRIPEGGDTLARNARRLPACPGQDHLVKALEVCLRRSTSTRRSCTSVMCLERCD